MKKLISDIKANPKKYIPHAIAAVSLTVAAAVLIDHHSKTLLVVTEANKQAMRDGRAIAYKVGNDIYGLVSMPSE